MVTQFCGTDSDMKVMHDCNCNSAGVETLLNSLGPSSDSATFYWLYRRSATHQHLQSCHIETRLCRESAYLCQRV